MVVKSALGSSVKTMSVKLMLEVAVELALVIIVISTDRLIVGVEPGFSVL